MFVVALALHVVAMDEPKCRGIDVVAQLPDRPGHRAILHHKSPLPCLSAGRVAVDIQSTHIALGSAFRPDWSRQSARASMQIAGLSATARHTRRSLSVRK